MKTIGETNNIPGKLHKSLISVNLKDLTSGINLNTGVQASVGEIIGNFDGLFPDFTNIQEGNPDDILISKNTNDLFMDSYKKNANGKGEIPISISLNTDKTGLHPKTKINKTIEAETIN